MLTGHILSRTTPPPNLLPKGRFPPPPHTHSSTSGSDFHPAGGVEAALSPVGLPAQSSKVAAGALYPAPPGGVSAGLHPIHLHTVPGPQSVFTRGKSSLPLWSQFAADSGLGAGVGKIKALDARICHELGGWGKPGLPRKGEE